MIRPQEIKGFHQHQQCTLTNFKEKTLGEKTLEKLLEDSGGKIRIVAVINQLFSNRDGKSDLNSCF